MRGEVGDRETGDVEGWRVWACGAWERWPAAAWTAAVVAPAGVGWEVAFVVMGRAVEWVAGVEVVVGREDDGDER